MGESARCWWEAKAAADIGAALTRIKQELDKNSKADITNVIDELQQNESRLRDISDYLRIYQNREYLVKDYLDLILPSLKKTLMDIYVLLAELRTTTFVKVWNKILMRMSLESNNSLHTRLIMYKTLLMQLSRLLSRPSAYEATVLKSSITKVLTLRAKQGLSPVVTMALPPEQSQVRIIQYDEIHWAQKIFDQKMDRTRLKNASEPSRCFGISSPEAALDIPPAATVLFRLKFDKNRLSVVLFMNSNQPDGARIQCRWTSPDGSPMYSSRGLHELRLTRSGSYLNLDEFNDDTKRVDPWLKLYFKYYEKMILFHEVFVVLKRFCPDTVWVAPEELVIGEEKRYFQARILDDNYHHVITLYEDRISRGVRLAATIWNGPCKRSPIWTAFLTASDIKKTFIKPSGSNKVLLKQLDINTYTNAGYDFRKQTTQRGCFKLQFVENDDADRFVKAWNIMVKNQTC